MLRVLSAADAARSGAEDVAVLLETHCTGGLTDEQVSITLFPMITFLQLM